MNLKDGERWSYSPPPGHEVAWVYPCRGNLQVSDDTVTTAELAIFAESNAALHFTAVGATEFVLGSAVKHPHELVLGYYSIHSSVEALQRGTAEIERVGQHLAETGKIDADRLKQALARIHPGSW